MKRIANTRMIFWMVCAISLLGTSARAGGFTETLPQGAILIDESIAFSWLDSMWDNGGNTAPLIESIDRYEPGGGKQGVITANPKANYLLLVNKLQYGILDNLSVGIGIPVVLKTKVDPRLGWEPGDYMRVMGRPYSEQDFWSWAESMGQGKPQKWEGNNGVLSDIILAARFRWSDYIEGFQLADVGAALMISGAIPTGQSPDREEVVAAGTTMWDLHTQGDIAIHVSFDKKFTKELDNRLILGLDLFYETFFTRELKSSEGIKHPLLLNSRPYVGTTYEINPGDFAGFSFLTDVVPYRGPAWGTWITGGDAGKAKNLPPILSFSITYTFTYLQQSDWNSNNATWDWKKEEQWRPGYKNALEAKIKFAFLRLGAPFMLYFSYKTLDLIPGKNCRAANLISSGIQIPMKFW